MPTPVSLFRTCIGLALPALAVLACGDAEVKVHQVPKAAQPLPPMAAPAASGPQRLLGAILPHDQQMWFVKLMGPADAVAPHAEALAEFARSAVFPEASASGEPIELRAPAGWTRKPGDGMRYASYAIAGTDPPLEASLTVLGGAAGGVLGNVNRWRGQVGLAAIAEAELASCATPLTGSSVPGALLVDLSGTGGAGAPPMAPAKAPPPRDPRFDFKVPQGWTEVAPSTMRAASFEVGAGAEKAQLAVIPLPMPAGSVLENVNRWRSQVSLGPTTQEALDAELKSIAVGSQEARLLDAIGPDNPGQVRQRILVAFFDRGAMFWSFKFFGPGATIERERAHFEQLLASWQWKDAGNG